MTRPEPATAELTVARFREAARELKQALADNAYPAADGTADIDNNAIDIIAVTIAHFVTAARSSENERCAKIAERGWPHVPLVERVTDEITKAIAARIRSSINPPGEEE